MRITKDQWAMDLAKVTAQRSTCLRRAVGCVLTNAHGHVLATGYNGVPSGMPHCNAAEEAVRHECPGAKSPSGTNLDGCHAVHAEQNALLQCPDVQDIDSCYVTVSPCITCTKLLLNTSCTKIFFNEEYAQPAAKELWTSTGRVWQKL